MTEKKKVRTGNQFMIHGFVLLSLTFGSVAAQAGDSPRLLRVTPELVEATEWLRQSPVGKQILKRAFNAKIEVEPGEVSKTEMTAVRQVEGRVETVQTQLRVFIAIHKDPIFQAMDLAHELVHAIHPAADPFDPGLNADSYVRLGIEGAGGEAQAILNECRVGEDLIPKLTPEKSKLIRARCAYVWSSKMDGDRWKNSFYQVGNYYEDFVKLAHSVRGQIEVENQSPFFASAVSHKPYPVTLLEEYIEMTRSLCQKSSLFPRLYRRCLAIGSRP